MKKKRTASAKKGMWILAVRNLCSRKRVQRICLSFYLIMALAYVSSNILMEGLKLGIQSARERVGADLIVVPKEYCSSIENALFQGYPCTVYFDQGWLEQTRGIEGVQMVTSQIFLATLNAECCDEAVQLIAFDESTDYLIQPWLQNQLKDNIKNHQVVIGANLNLTVGEHVTYYGIDFEIVGRLEKTGMGYDSCVFMTQEAARELAASKIGSQQLLLANHPEFISAVMIQAEEGISITKVKENLLESYREKGFDTTEITIESSSDLFRKITDSFGKMKGYATIINIVIVGMATLALVCLNLLLIDNRRKEFGIYLTLGARKTQLYQLVLYETGLLSLAGGLVGTVLSVIILCLFGNLIRSGLRLPYLTLNPLHLLLLSGKTLLLTAGVGIAAVMVGVYEIMKWEPIALVKENG